jgi:hypothetical protein
MLSEFKIRKLKDESPQKLNPKLFNSKTLKSNLSSEREIVVREHDTLGHAGGSGGVDEVAALVDSDPFEAIF